MRSCWCGLKTSTVRSTASNLDNRTLFLSRQELHQGTNQQELIQIAEYYFDGQGKALRPMVTMLMGKAINYHMHRENRLVFVLFVTLCSPSAAFCLGLSLGTDQRSPTRDVCHFLAALRTRCFKNIAEISQHMLLRFFAMSAELIVSHCISRSYKSRLVTFLIFLIFRSPLSLSLAPADCSNKFKSQIAATCIELRASVARTE